MNFLCDKLNAILYKTYAEEQCLPLYISRKYECTFCFATNPPIETLQCNHNKLIWFTINCFVTQKHSLYETMTKIKITDNFPLYISTFRIFTVAFAEASSFDDVDCAVSNDLCLSFYFFLPSMIVICDNYVIFFIQFIEWLDNI